MDGGSEIVIVGDSSLAQMAYEYITHDSPHKVVGFSVEQAYLKRKELFGLPVVPFEHIEDEFQPGKFKVSVAIGYNQLNRVRERLFLQTMEKGYSLYTYVSSQAFVWKNVKLGMNCFVFEQARIQPFAEIGNNVVAWGSVGISHHVVIHDNVFIAGQAAIGGHTEVGKNCFIGMNCSISNNLRIAEDCVIGAGAIITKDTEAGKVYRGSQATLSHRSSFEVFGVQSGQ